MTTVRRSVFPITALVLLSSCALSTRTYVNRHWTFDCYEGDISRIENLDGTIKARLNDGVATQVGGVGCRVYLGTGMSSTVIDVPRGSVVVMTRSKDFVLIDRSSSPETESDSEPEEPPIEDPAESVEEKDVDPLAAAAAAKQLREARTNLAANQYREALSGLERAYEIDSTNPEIAAELISLLKRLGLELYSKGRLDEAISHWTRVLEVAPNDIVAQRFIHRARTIEKNN